MATSKVGSYIGNLGKSISYAAVDVLKDNAKTTGSFIETNQELFKSIYSDVKNYKVTYNRLGNKVVDSKLYKAGEQLKVSIFEDIKSGKFYNKDREDEINLKSMGKLGEDDEFDFDMDFDFDSEPDNDSTSRVERATIKSAEMTSQVVARTGEYIVESGKTNTKILSLQNAQSFAVMNSGLHTITNQIAAMTNILSGPGITHMDNSRKFFEGTTNKLTEITNILKEMNERQSKIYTPAQKPPSKKETFNDIIDSTGAADLTRYFQNVQKNLKKAMGPEGEMLFGDTMGEGSNMLLAFTSNPLAFIPKMIVKTLVPMSLSKAFKSIDTTISGLFGNLVAGFNKMANRSDNPILKKIGEIFGISSPDKTGLDPSKYTKGAVPFDGITRKSIIEVIPGHLRRIERLLGGGNERIFDYESGKWTTDKKIVKEFKDMKHKNIANAFDDIIPELAAAMNRVAPEQKRDMDAMMAKMDKALERIYSDYGSFRFADNRTANEYAEYGFDNESQMKLFMNMFKNMPKSKVVTMANKVLSERDSSYKKMNRMEEEGMSSFFNIFNDSISNTDMSKYKSDKSKYEPSNILRTNVDEKGHNIFYYLQGILGSLIRREQGESNGNRGRAGRGKSSNRVSGSGNLNISNLIDSIPDLNETTRESDRRKVASEQESYRRRTSKTRRGSSYDPYGNDDNLHQSMATLDIESHVLQQLEEREDYEHANPIQRAIQDAARKYNSQDGTEAYDNKGKKRGFLDRLLAAGTLGDKMSVMKESMGNLINKPAEMLTGMLNKADQRLYQLLFGYGDMKDRDGKPIKGFLDYTVYQMKESFQKFNTFLDEKILQPLKDKFGIETFGDAFDKLATAVGFDKERRAAIKAKAGEVIKPYKEATKRAFGGAWNDIKTSTIDVYNPIIQKFKAGERTEPVPQGTTEESPIQQNAKGARYITKSGITAISKGEMVIPSELNPLNPDRFNVNKDREIRNEMDIKDRFINSLKGSIGIHASGTDSYDPQKESEGKRNIVQEAIQDAKTGGAYIIRRLSGNEKKDDEALKKALKDISSNIQEYAPEAVGYGLLGGTVSLLTGAVGGPLLGAAAGAAIGLVKKSKGLQDMLFGKEIEGTDEREGGVVSTKVQQAFKKYFPNMKKYGLAGAVTGLLTPFGPIGGLMMGSAIGFAKSNDGVQDFLFGKLNDETGKKEGGLITEETVNKIKKASPRMLTGAVAGTLLGPFGILGNATLGAGIGLITTTDKFQDIMFGPIDPKTGEREGGIIGAVRTGVIEPIKDALTGFKDQFLDFMQEKVMDPLKNFVEPVGHQIKLMFEGIGRGVTDWFTDRFEKTLGIPLDQLIKDKLIDPLGHFIGGAIKGFMKPFKAVVSAPFALLGGIGNATRRRQIKSGDAYNMTAAERLEFMRQKPGMVNKFFGKSGYKLEGLDTLMSGQDADQIGNISELLGDFTGGHKYFEKQIFSEKKAMSTEVLRYLRKSGLDKKMGVKQRNAFLKAAQSGDLKSARKILNNRTKGFGERIDMGDQNELFDMIKEHSGSITSLRDRKKNSNREKGAILDELSKAGLTGVNAKNAYKYLKMYQTESKSRSKGGALDDSSIESSGVLAANAAMREMVDNKTTSIIHILEDLRDISLGLMHPDGSKIRGRKGIYKDGRTDAQTEKSENKNAKGDSYDLNINSKFRKVNDKTLTKLSKHYGGDSLKEGTIEKLGNERYGKRVSSLVGIADMNGGSNKFSDEVLDRMVNMDHDLYTLVAKVQKIVPLDNAQIDKLSKLNDSKSKVKFIKTLIAMGYKFDKNFDAILQIANINTMDRSNTLALVKKDKRLPVNDLLALLDPRNMAKREYFLRNGKPSKSKKPETNNIEAPVASTGGAAREIGRNKTKGPNAGDLATVSMHAVGTTNVSSDETSVLSKGEMVTDSNSKVFKEATDRNKTIAENSDEQVVVLKRILNNMENTNNRVVTKSGKVITLVRQTDGGVGPGDDKDTREAIAEQQEESETQKGILASLKKFSIGGFLKNKLGIGKSEEDEDEDTKKGSWLKSIFSGKVGKILGTSFGALTAVAVTGHIGKWWDEKAFPAIKNWLAESEFGNKVLGAIDKVTGAIGNLFVNIKEWFSGTGKFKDRGLPYFWTNGVVPFYVDGIAYFMEKMIPGAITLLIKALPPMLMGVVKGIGAILRTPTDIFLGKKDLRKNNEKITIGTAFSESFGKSDGSSAVDNATTPGAAEFVRTHFGAIGKAYGSKTNTKEEYVVDNSSYGDYDPTPKITINVPGSGGSNTSNYYGNGETGYNNPTTDYINSTVDDQDDREEYHDPIFNPLDNKTNNAESVAAAAIRSFMTGKSGVIAKKMKDIKMKPIKSVWSVPGFVARGIGKTTGNIVNGAANIGNMARGPIDPNYKVNKFNSYADIYNNVLANNADEIARRRGMAAGTEVLDQAAKNQLLEKLSIEKIGNVAEATAKAATDDTAESMIRLADEAATSGNNKLIAGIMSKATEVSTKISSNSTIIKFVALGIEKAKAATGKAATEMATKLLAKCFKMILKAFGENIAKMVVKAAAKLVGIFGPGYCKLITVAFIVADFMSGFKNANSILGIIDQPTFGMRIITGLLKTVNGIITLGIVPESVLVDIFIDVLAPVLKLNVNKLKAERADAEQEVIEANKYLADEDKYTTVGEYNARNSLGTKIKKALDSGWKATKDGVSNFFNSESVIGAGGRSSWEAGIDATKKPVIIPDDNSFNTKAKKYFSKEWKSFKDGVSNFFKSDPTSEKGGRLAMEGGIDDPKKSTAKSLSNISTMNSLMFSMVPLTLNQNLANIADATEKYGEQMMTSGKYLDTVSSNNLKDLNRVNSSGKFSDAIKAPNTKDPLQTIAYWTNKIFTMPLYMAKFMNNQASMLYNSNNIGNSFSLMASMAGPVSFNRTGSPIMTSSTAPVTNSSFAAMATAAAPKSNSTGNYFSSSMNNFQNMLGRGGKGGDDVAQVDSSVSGIKFNNPNDTQRQTIGDSGCAPVAVSNLINSLGSKISVKDAANYAISNGFKDHNGGTQIQYFSSILKDYNISSSTTENPNDAFNALKNGNQVVVLGQSRKGSKSGPFGGTAHYITATGIDPKTNKIIVDDPNSKNRRTLYNAKDIFGNGSGFVTVGGGFGSGSMSLSGFGRSATNSNDIIHQNLGVFSPLSVAEMNAWIDRSAPKGSPFRGNGAIFIEASNQSGLDPRYLLAHAAIESTWGSSNIAKNKNNYFGISAFDSNSGAAYSYNGLTGGIIEGAKWIAKNYYRNTKPQTTIYLMRYSPSGTHNYCTSSTWPTSLADIMKKGPVNTNISYDQTSLANFNANPNSGISVSGLTNSSNGGLLDAIGNMGYTALNKVWGEDTVKMVFGDTSNPFASESSSDASMDAGSLSQALPVQSAANYNPTNMINAVVPSYGAASISSKYGMRNHPVSGKRGMHNGVDIAAPGGTPITCPMAGTVATSAYNSSYGNYVDITTTEGYTLRFAHMSERGVSVGATVKPGDILGRVGKTGSSTGNHLHFEIRTPDGKTVDPSTALAFSGSGSGTRNRTPNNILTKYNYSYSDKEDKNRAGGSEIETVNVETNKVYVAMLNAIVSSLCRVADNTDKLNEILKLLSEKLNIDIPKDKLTSSGNNKSATMEEIQKAISSSMKNTQTPNSVSNNFADKDTEYILKAMASIAAQ